ncbi:Serine/threonine protein phosphatase PrpC [Duganella sacchari]|uniref:Serine/threonine protein phosphatase PrpC n=1 Tax=Duganella sacchari TaxID=551987 RepID=A0A1M7R4R8_9BURK|nr:protein phosphatase [Duganella sacchari]SHN40165.1 Serine/threonine protein phosphatase PrpC [Duganella sacchari]
MTHLAPTTAALSAKLWPFAPRAAAPAPMTRITDHLDFGPGLDVAARSAASISKLQVPENQDNLLIIDTAGRAVLLLDQKPHATQLPDWPAGHVRLAVLDGMGGHGHGRQAAEAVATGLLRIPACSTLEQLGARLDQLHLDLQARFSHPGDHDSFRRPGTTLTLLEIPPGQPPMLFHAGDSRLYEITGQHARPLTIDHVPATAFAMHGLLGEQEWWQQVHGEHRAQISQAYILGNAFANPQVLEDGLMPLHAANLPPFLQQLADRRAIQVCADATYLLATDGFWACADPQPWIERWPSLLNQPAGAALDALFTDYAANPPPQLHIDNLSAIVLRFSAATAGCNVDETALPVAPMPAHF